MVQTPEKKQHLAAIDPNFSFGNADMNFLKNQHEESHRMKAHVIESTKVI